MMSERLSELLREIHRRSVWQVVGIYLAMSWGVLNAVDVLTGFAGLPDWTPTMAVVLLLIGLPVVTATAVIQKGLPGGAESAESGEGVEDGRAEIEVAQAGDQAVAPASHGRLFTWRNAILGGIGAFALLGFSLIAYFVMWTTGIGPVGNLKAQGVFEEGEAVVLADFENRTSDEGLGAVVTETLRVDLGASGAITLVAPVVVEQTLGLMQRDLADGLPADVAREVAIRGGIKAVVDGEVGAAGSGYILTATIREADSGVPLATFRRTADGPDAVIAAIDGLSQDIRERAGESLRDIKSEGGLADVTTSSLEALRLYSRADELLDRGEADRAADLLEQALELDPEFAMAWRKLSVVARSAAEDPALEPYAATRAYELRDRLTEVERLYATAYYNDIVTGDVSETVRAYETILDFAPDDPTALNNISIAVAERAQWESALEYLGMADAVAPMANARTNMSFYASALGRVGLAEEAMAAANEVREDGTVWGHLIQAFVALADGDGEGLVVSARAMELNPDFPTSWRSVGVRLGLTGQVMQGHWEEGIRGFQSGRDPLIEGQESERLIFAYEQALVHYYLFGDSGPGSALIRTAKQTGTYDVVPPPARDYLGLTRALVILGDAAQGRDVLDEWRSTEGALQQARTQDIGLLVDAIDAGPGERIAAFERYRDATGCDRCYSWEYAEMLAEDGRAEAAVAEYEKAMAAMAYPQQGHLWPILRIVGHERLGALHEELGDRARAIEHYQQFVEVWSDALPPLRERVEVAHARIAALGG